jgi:alkanesulfonate monooxygenase SsuD/methylene tetrahydromethanopterin reductase-like flavin-dependent oxidoreductase (luciferase family)
MAADTDAEILELVVALQAADEERKRPTRDRHSRESAAQIGFHLSISREQIRKAKRLREAAQADPERCGPLWAALQRNQITIDAAYRTLQGDKRRPVYLNLPEEVADALEEECHERGLSRPQLIERLLRQRYGLQHN